MLGAPSFAKDIRRPRAPVLESAGPSLIPACVFESCPVPVRWAAYWYDAGSRPGTPAGLCVAAFWGNAHCVFPLVVDALGEALDWNSVKYDPDIGHLQLGELQDTPEAFATCWPSSMDGNAREDAWLAVWLAVGRAVKGLALPFFGGDVP